MPRKRTTVDVTTIRETRDQLVALLDAVKSGQVTAPPGLVARLEGAITALESLLSVLDIH